MGEYIRHPELQVEIKVGVADAKHSKCFLTREALIELKGKGYQGYYGGEYDETIENMLNNPITTYGDTTSDQAQDEEVENLWNQFADVPFDSQNYRILSDFHLWSAGTDKDTIWGWFNRNHSEGVYHLLQEHS